MRRPLFRCATVGRVLTKTVRISAITMTIFFDITWLAILLTDETGMITITKSHKTTKQFVTSSSCFADRLELILRYQPVSFASLFSFAALRKRASKACGRSYLIETIFVSL